MGLTLREGTQMVIKSHLRMTYQPWLQRWLKVLLNFCKRLICIPLNGNDLIAAKQNGRPQKRFSLHDASHKAFIFSEAFFLLCCGVLCKPDPLPKWCISGAGNLRRENLAVAPPLNGEFCNELWSVCCFYSLEAGLKNGDFQLHHVRHFKVTFQFQRWILLEFLPKRV